MGLLPSNLFCWTFTCHSSFWVVAHSFECLGLLASPLLLLFTTFVCSPRDALPRVGSTLSPCLLLSGPTHQQYPTVWFLVWSLATCATFTAWVIGMVDSPCSRLFVYCGLPCWWLYVCEQFLAVRSTVLLGGSLQQFSLAATFLFVQACCWLSILCSRYNATTHFFIFLDWLLQWSLVFWHSFVGGVTSVVCPRYHARSRHRTLALSSSWFPAPTLLALRVASELVWLIAMEPISFRLVINSPSTSGGALPAAQCPRAPYTNKY